MDILKIKDNPQFAACRHCKHWNDYHLEGNACVVWMSIGAEHCGCPKWESNDNLLYLEVLNEHSSNA